MQQIPPGEAARSVLTDDAFVVPPVPAAARGVGWLRASVARFSSGEDHRRRRALVVGLLDRIDPATLRSDDAVAALAAALGLDAPSGLVADVAQAYQPGTGSEARADAAVDALVARLGGRFDEATAAAIGLLVQACQATATLIERCRHAPIDTVLRDDPPAPSTKRLAVTDRPARADRPGVRAGEVVRVSLAGGLAFGAGPHACPGEPHARALASAGVQ